MEGDKYTTIAVPSRLRQRLKDEAIEDDIPVWFLVEQLSKKTHALAHMGGNPAGRGLDNTCSATINVKADTKKRIKLAAVKNGVFMWVQLENLLTLHSVGDILD